DTTCSTTPSSARSIRTPGSTTGPERRRIRCSASSPHRACRGVCSLPYGLLSETIFSTLILRSLSMKRAFLLVAFLLVASLCVALSQQDMGAITGVISAPTGAAVPAARVTVTNRETAETRTVSSSDGGAYTVGPLRVGRYTISVEKQGFKKSVQQDVELHAQDRVRADLKLEVGQM